MGDMMQLMFRLYGEAGWVNVTSDMTTFYECLYVTV